MDKSKVMCIERNKEPLPEDVSMRVGEGMKTFGAMKNMWSCRGVSLNVKKE